MKQEILLASYYEHLKFAKDFAKYLPIDHPKRLRVENEINSIAQQLNQIEL